MGVLLLARKGIPEDTGTLFQRIARTVIAVAVFFGVSFGIEYVIEVMSGHEADLLEAVKMFAAVFVTTWGATELNIRFGFLRARQKSSFISRGISP